MRHPAFDHVPLIYPSYETRNAFAMQYATPQHDLFERKRIVTPTLLPYLKSFPFPIPRSNIGKQNTADPLSFSSLHKFTTVPYPTLPVPAYLSSPPRVRHGGRTPCVRAGRDMRRGKRIIVLVLSGEFLCTCRRRCRRRRRTRPTGCGLRRREAEATWSSFPRRIRVEEAGAWRWGHSAGLGGDNGGG